MARQTTLKGNSLPLEGPELKVGDTVPDVTLKKSLADPYKISDGNGKVRLFSVVPSLDTPVCAEQTRRFNREAASLPDVQFITVSVDLPTGQARFCGDEGISPEKVMVLSDHFDCALGKAWGTLIPGLRISSRALFVLDKQGTIKHVQYVPEVADHPAYDAALATLKSLSHE